MKPLTSIYSYRFPATLTYMLQSTEYQTKPYLKWLWRTRDFSKVQHRRQLDQTDYAKMLVLFLKLGMLFEIISGIILISVSLAFHRAGLWEYGLALIVAYPLVWSNLIVIPLEIGRLGVVEPKQKQQIAAARNIFSNHPAVKIAVVGSYGKTSMKEVLKTVLAEGKRVAATEANYNVAIAHAKFAEKLSGQEEVLIIEYGEGSPGDVARFSYNTNPSYAVITGLAPAHLDHYKTLDAAGADIFSVADYLDGNNVYVNRESSATKKFIKPSYITYGNQGIGEWKVAKIQNSLTGIKFELYNSQTRLRLESALIGRHQIGVLSLAAVLALDLGLSIKQVERGINKTSAFEHRMQPYQLSGAWIIDDTYNGNIDGIKAGAALLGELPANRKIYISPGLVEQGPETRTVHIEMGHLIAAAKPEIVVLMANSTTADIKTGLDQAEYKGQIRIEQDPLTFYNNLAHFVAKGDLVLMQNDWTDNYA